VLRFAVATLHGWSSKDFTLPFTAKPFQENSMKNLRQFCVALVFTLALTTPAFAGQIETPLAPPTTTSAATTEGQIETPVAGQIETPSGEATASDSATEIALNLLQSVLALF
jgi:hypothetical protein